MRRDKTRATGRRAELRGVAQS